uniref:Transposase n=1 Tax=Knipowitschia caucasica TaxID=637954 RepID=A0AAV2JFR5_KNICA
MDENTAQGIHLARAHRLGQQREGASRSRPIVAKLLDPRHKAVIMGKGRELKGTKLAISDQFPQEIMRRRRLLQPILAEARTAGKRSRLSIDKLYIDGTLYRNSKITYWLTGSNDNTVTQR